MASPLISIAQAQKLVRSCTCPLESERIPVSEAVERVLAKDIQAAADQPPFASSAMDGYAVSDGEEVGVFHLLGESRAGGPFRGAVGPREAVRISTGAAVPAGASAVIRQEDADGHDGSVTTRAAVARGENIRPAGEVMRAGETVLRAGTTMRSGELGVAVTAGASELVVSRRPRVEVLCTGDELRDPGEPLGPGEIYNSNGPMLVALAARQGSLAPPAGHLPDDRHETEAGLARALASADLVIVSGGVSVGPHDHVKPALAALGVDERFWGVALQPGKPTWFGIRERTLVFGLPGNPVSAAVTFALFVSPALAALQGKLKRPLLDGSAELGTTVKRNRAREQALRVRLERHAGRTVAFPNGSQASHVITSLVGADALALIPPGDGELEAGTTVALEPLPR